MKLFHLVLWRLSLALVVVFTVWAWLFYWAIIEEVNDEVDDSLEDYSEQLIVRALLGEEMPDTSNGSNNQYYLYEVSKEYAAAYPQITYRDEMVYITEKREEEPARVLITIFQAPNDRYMELVVYTPTIEKMDLQRAILGWIVFLYVMLLLVILLITAWVYRRNMKPLYHLLGWLDRYQLGHPNEPLDNKTTITEFHHLNETVTEFAGRNEKLFEQQKQFIGNASHEMQTPLAICRNRLEMLMEDENLSERQLEELMKTHRTLENLTRMNRSLLLLCKIENGQYMDKRPVCLNELLKNNKIELVADWNKKIDIEKDDYGDKDVVFWGDLNIYFVYHAKNGHSLHLQWYRGGSSTEYDIYLMNEDWGYKIRTTHMEKEHGDRKRYYCFNFNIDESSGELLADQFCSQVEEEFAEFIKNPAE